MYSCCLCNVVEFSVLKVQEIYCRVLKVKWFKTIPRPHISKTETDSGHSLHILTKKYDRYCLKIILCVGC